LFSTFFVLHLSITVILTLVLFFYCTSLLSYFTSKQVGMATKNAMVFRLGWASEGAALNPGSSRKPLTPGSQPDAMAICREHVILP